MSLRRLLGGLAAGGILVGLGAGVPAVLVVAVGNPWPGWERVQLGDERALLVGALAVVAWVVWARFLLALVSEVPSRLRERRVAPVAVMEAPVTVSAPSGPAGGVGWLAARLVAAALVLLPMAGRAAPVAATAATPPPLAASAAASPLTAAASASSHPGPATRPAAAEPAETGPAGSSTRDVRVSEGDTLVGLARRYLGDATRWRDIFELNRDRPQVGGGRLSSPSTLQPGWTLVLPNGAHPAAAGNGAETVVIDVGDTLWELAHDRLERAGQTHDDPSVANYVRAIVAVNSDQIEDPDLILAGRTVALPAVAPGSGASTEATPAAPPGDPADAPPDATPDATTTPAPAVPTADPVTTPPERVNGSRAATPPTRPATTTVTTAATAAAATAAAATAAAGTAASAVPATTTTSEPAVPIDRPADADPEGAERAPSPIGLGEAALLSTGVVALVAARRRARLRASRPRARLPEPAPEQVTTERVLRSVDADHRLLRLDVALRAAASALLDTRAQPAVARVGSDGRVELVLTGPAHLPVPWREDTGRWVLPGNVPIELLAEASRTVGAPCLALTQLGVDDQGHDVFADLEALGVLAIQGRDEDAEPVLHGIAATLATSLLADVVNLVAVEVAEQAFVDHRRTHRADTVEEAVELATTLIGTTASARQSTFVLRARHTSGEAWEPSVVLTGPLVAHEVTPELVRSVSRRPGGVAMVVAGDVPDGRWTLRRTGSTWRLDPLGLDLTPVGLTATELAAVYEVLRDADAPLLDQIDPVDQVDEEPTSPLMTASTHPSDRSPTGGFVEPPWELLVRLIGPVDVVDRTGASVAFDRSKTLELIAWLTLHRDRSTRTGARTALWDLDVRDATFANVVSEARRATARHVRPPEGEEWLERTLTERLPLHRLVVSDVDLVRARLQHARLQPPQQAIDTLRPAVELIRDVPFAGTGFLWPDPEGITSNVVLLATAAAAELAGHLLSMGDVDGVFWATGLGLRVLPGHEELIALRMRAHHRAGDLSGVRLEWETYERLLDADPWSVGEPAPKLVALRRELLHASA